MASVLDPQIAPKGEARVPTPELMTTAVRAIARPIPPSAVRAMTYGHSQLQLGSSSFLARLRPDEAADLMGRGRRRRWRKGATLFGQGDSSRWVAVLLSGMVKVCVPTEQGDEVLLGVRGPGALVGALEVSDGKPRGATAAALQPVEALIVPPETFSDFLAARGVFRLLIEELCEQLREAERQRVGIETYNVAQRLARQLVELADRYGEEIDGGVRVSLALTQHDLASWIGASRESVSKALRSLRMRELIETGRRSVLILDLAALRDIAELTLACAHGHFPPLASHGAPCRERDQHAAPTAPNI